MTPAADKGPSPRLYSTAMRIRARLIPRSGIDWLGRFFWLGLAVMHIVPLIACAGLWLGEPTTAGAIRVMMLLGALVFFGSKVAGVRYLPVASPRLGVVVFLVTCGLVHSEVRAAAMTDAATPLIAVATISTALGVSEAWTRRKRLAGVLRAAFGRVDAIVSPTFWLGRFDPHRDDAALAAVVCSAPPRAPPIR